MSAPRHLWSGDWEQDSAAHAEALARRSAQRAEEPELPEEEQEPESRVQRRAAAVARASAVRSSTAPAAPLGPTLGERLAALSAALGRGLLVVLRWIGLAVLALAKGLRAIVRGGWRALKRADRARLRLAAAAVLVIAVVAVAAVALFGSGSGPPNANASPAAIASIDHWLGVQLTYVPSRGVVIESLDPNGTAGQYGFEPGDTLAQIDNRAINTLGNVASAFSRVQPGNQVAITVNRGSTVYSVNFPMPPHPPGGP
jgi:hypothetical protein